ncbi:MAG: TIGR00341 family protein [Candidatus Aminicenantes bacterium]|jgi:uncharacterized hydrophobic protein (TIGR00341 family)
MAIRLIEIVLPALYQTEVNDILKSYESLELWQERIDENRLRIKFILPTGKTEEVLDSLEKRFSTVEGFRIILLPVEASIPRLKTGEEQDKESIQSEKKEKSLSKSVRISRAELYAEAEKTTRFSWVFILLTLLSSFVASIGILRSNVVFIIGAMVIAPVLGPNVALSLATTLGDLELSRKAIKAIAAGILVAFGFSVFLGLVLFVDTSAPELVSRTEVNFGDIILALAAGSAAALSFTSGLLSALIGVMVAVALLPPLVTVGMLAGAGSWEMALGSLLLFLTNFICVNLAGVLTFIAQGIRPLTWWEASKAKKAALRAVLVWCCLLIFLVVMIVLSSKN